MPDQRIEPWLLAGLAAGIRTARRFVAHERLFTTTDAGLSRYPRASARAMLAALVEGVAAARAAD